MSSSHLDLAMADAKPVPLTDGTTTPGFQFTVITFAGGVDWNDNAFVRVCIDRSSIFRIHPLSPLANHIGPPLTPVCLFILHEEQLDSAMGESLLAPPTADKPIEDSAI